MPEIQPADPAARRRALIGIVLVVVVVMLIALAVDHWLGGVLLEPALARPALAAALRWSSAAVSLMVLAFAVYSFMLGRRIMQAQRFPLPGVAVIRDTVIVEGAAALRRGLLIQMIAAMLAVLALLLFLTVFYLAARLG